MTTLPISAIGSFLAEDIRDTTAGDRARDAEPQQQQ